MAEQNNATISIKARYVEHVHEPAEELEYHEGYVKGPTVRKANSEQA